LVTEELNRRWYEANTGEVITDSSSKEAHRQSQIVAQGPHARRDQDFIDAISLQPGD
jgi:hypothetical protein